MPHPPESAPIQVGPSGTLRACLDRVAKLDELTMGSVKPG